MMRKCQLCPWDSCNYPSLVKHMALTIMWYMHHQPPCPRCSRGGPPCRPHSNSLVAAGAVAPPHLGPNGRLRVHLGPINSGRLLGASGACKKLQGVRSVGGSTSEQKPPQAGVPTCPTTPPSNHPAPTHHHYTHCYPPPPPPPQSHLLRLCLHLCCCPDRWSSPWQRQRSARLHSATRKPAGCAARSSELGR